MANKKLKMNREKNVTVKRFSISTFKTFYESGLKLKLEKIKNEY
jgi:hypothetical protein